MACFMQFLLVESLKLSNLWLLVVKTSNALVDLVEVKTVVHRWF